MMRPPGEGLYWRSRESKYPFKSRTNRDCAERAPWGHTDGSCCSQNLLIVLESGIMWGL